ncbi:MAG TPA: glycosyltransferase family 39 protein [Bryobacteraceae bacterium]
MSGIGVVAERPESKPALRGTFKSSAKFSARLPYLLPYLGALSFALWSLRGVGHSDIVDTDAARHAMNGAFIYDLVRGGHLTHPIDFAKAYYGHLPAITMPFHPVVFPAIVSGFYALFGVKALSARLAVALAVGICFLLLYRLVEATLRNSAIAACTAITVLSIWRVQLVATDVMLELPAMAFTLAALYCLRDLTFQEEARAFPWGRALLFTVLGGLAISTKQHAVFLGGVPVLGALLTRRWRLLKRPQIWISAAVLLGIGAGWALVWAHFQGSARNGNQVASSPQALRLIPFKNARLYSQWIWEDLTALPGIFAVCSIAAFACAVWKRQWRRAGLSLEKVAHNGLAGRGQARGVSHSSDAAPGGLCALYLAWMISAALVLLVLGAVDPRYLFFLIPAAIVTAYAMLWRGCASLWGERRAWYVPTLFGIAWFLTGLFFQPEYLRGPAEAAALVTESGTARVLYAGEADGNFIFAVRSRDPNMQTTVIPAEKLPASTFGPEALERFCRHFGINWIVLEDVPLVHEKWSSMAASPAPSMRLERSFPLESSRTRWQNGRIQIYRFAAPFDPGGGVLELPVRKLDHPIKIKL